MSISESKYQSDLYLHFKEIRSDEYRSIIRFFEMHKQQINELDFREYFELKVSYITSLYKTAAYNAYIQQVDSVIEDSIAFNIRLFQGRDIFRELLFKKASAHFHLQEHSQAKHILHELIKMAPDCELYLKTLRKVLSSKKPQYIRHTRAGSVLIFMFTTLVIAIEILVIRNFWPFLTSSVEYFRNILFGLGVATLIGGELFHRFQINRATKQLLQTVRHKKKRPANQEREEELVG
ncbi:MAG: hypothetical protein AAFV95_02970 [Bacteroidota bacterium]